MKRHRLLPLTSAVCLLAASPLLAQPRDRVLDAAAISADYVAVPNITYMTANGYEAKLDVHRARNVATPRPTVIFIHGGGWVGGSKEASMLAVLPYLAMGFAAVNVEYRLAQTAPAPSGVEDCRCALKWVIANAKTHGFDTSKVVVTGQSAGGHLALMTGMLGHAAGFDDRCPTLGGPPNNVPIEDNPKVAAVVNWYGITDVLDIIQGPNARGYGVRWFAGVDNKAALAARVSPLTYVRPGLPPIITIHGDADPTVPYAQAERLRDALTKAGVANQLVTIPQGGHGNFVAPERDRAWTAIRAFLDRLSIPPAVTSGQ
jgi:acetyl esterase/lipase